MFTDCFKSQSKHKVPTIYVTGEFETHVAGDMFDSFLLHVSEKPHISSCSIPNWGTALEIMTPRVTTLRPTRSSGSLCEGANTTSCINKRGWHQQLVPSPRGLRSPCLSTQVLSQSGIIHWSTDQSMLLYIYKDRYTHRFGFNFQEVLP